MRDDRKKADIIREIKEMLPPHGVPTELGKLSHADLVRLCAGIRQLSGKTDSSGKN